MDDYWQKGGGRYWAVHYTSPQSFMITFSYSLALETFYWTFIAWVITLHAQTFQLLIVIYRRDSFVYHHCIRICEYAGELNFYRFPIFFTSNLNTSCLLKWYMIKNTHPVNKSSSGEIKRMTASIRRVAQVMDICGYY